MYSVTSDMSGASLSPPPPEGSEFYDVHEQGIPLVMSPDTPVSRSLSSSSPLTRTVAILKTHALQDRLDIEPRLLEANFEVSAVQLGSSTAKIQLYPRPDSRG